MSITRAAHLIPPDITHPQMVKGESYEAPQYTVFYHLIQFWPQKPPHIKEEDKL